MEKVLYSIFVVNLDKINITMIQVSDTAKRKSSIWWRGRFWRCYRLRKSGKVADVLFVLWFKIWQSQSEDDKIFIDNEITIAVEKNLSFI
jgi:hypothetical protein